MERLKQPYYKNLSFKRKRCGENELLDRFREHTIRENRYPEYAATPVSPETETETTTSTDVAEDSFVYVHCHLRNYSNDALIRIWKTTYLADHGSAHRSELIHAENITFAPQWTRMPGGFYSFLLIFSGLPRSCVQFDLIEDIPQPGGFTVKNIVRNDTDVYHVDL